MRRLSKRDVVLLLAAWHAWPQVWITLSAPVGPGVDAWMHFVTQATPRRVQQAYVALQALPEHPPDTIARRLV